MDLRRWREIVIGGGQYPGGRVRDVSGRCASPIRRRHPVLSAMVTRAAMTGEAEKSPMQQLSELRAVNLQLQTTIDQLRGELEIADGRTAGAVQKARAEAATEANQLKSTIQTLRDQMEQQAIAADSATQSVRAAGQAEANQLRATIGQIRAELEHAQIQAGEAIVKEQSLFARERATLQQQIQALREQLDSRP
jgi:Ribonuclease G/E